jgi:hypothetical protein
VKLLTSEQYETRFAELTEAREKADADFRRANLAAEMGDGTEADIRDAKLALEMVNARLGGLESAWVETQRLISVDRTEQRNAAHQKLAHEVDGLLAEREFVVEGIEAMALMLRAAFAEYDSLSSKLTAAGREFWPHIARFSRDELVAKRWSGFSASLVRTPQLQPLATSVMDGQRVLAAEHPLVDVEKSLSKQVRHMTDRLSLEGIEL